MKIILYLLISVKYSKNPLIQLYREKFPRITNKYGKHATPIKKVSFEYSSGDLSKEHSAKKKLIQFPLKLSWALTAHKVQGQTFKEPQAVGVDLQTTFGAGKFAMAYVMLGRTENLSQLYLAPFDDKRFGARSGPMCMNEELEKKALVNKINDTWQSSENTFRLTSLNINSLNCHFDDLAVDSCILRSEAIAISENWYNKENCNPANLNGFNGYHVMAGRGKGVSLFLAEHLIMKEEPILVNMEFMQMIKVKFK